MIGSKPSLDVLSELLYRFVKGGDQSQESVKEIDFLLTKQFPGGEGFPNAALFEDLEIAVACYRPGGGQFMYDEKQMTTICSACLAAIKQKNL
jgi:hypothetical protein